jgi:hypothetical protein
MAALVYYVLKLTLTLTLKLTLSTLTFHPPKLFQRRRAHPHHPFNPSPPADGRFRQKNTLIPSPYLYFSPQDTPKYPQNALFYIIFINNIYFF